MDFIKHLAGKLLGNAGGDEQSRNEAREPSAAADGEGVVKLIWDEILATTNRDKRSLNDSPRWVALKGDPDTVQISVLHAASDAKLSSRHRYSYQVEELRRSMVSQLIRRNLCFSDTDLIHLLDSWQAQKYGLPGKSILGAVERHATQNVLPASLRAALVRIRQHAIRHTPAGAPATKFTSEVLSRIDALLNPRGEVAMPVLKGAFADSVKAWLDGLASAEQTAWRSLLALATEAGDKAKPSRKWLDSAKTAIDGPGAAAVEARIRQSLNDTTPDPAVIDLSLDMLKGLVWMVALLPGEDMAGLLGRFCEKCFRKVPGLGARSVKLGNAALWALSERALEPMAAAELIRLREKVKYPSARKVIETRLGELASKAGQSVEALEDMSLPDFGLDADGRAVVTIGSATAEIAATATETDLTWKNASGGVVKSIPADVRRDHAAGLTAIRSRVKDIEAARSAQISRLEQSWVEDRTWTFSDWDAHFRRHPLRRGIVAALIWRIAQNGKAIAAMIDGDGLIDVTGKPVHPSADAQTRLWHPLDSDPAEVLAWRQIIIDRGLTQPIKQAHREIYVLTDAERRTDIYSNRFAAHILRQHQFRALCQTRGWRYGLMGGWDGWNVPERPLPKLGLIVQYQVEAIEDGQRSETYVSLHITTDQVRFLDARGQPVPLVDIAPIVFSEALRDVDLFVAVTSIANDPGWTDGGPDGRYGGYWREWAFGDLGQSAETRKSLITALAPRLSIRDKLEVTDKFLVVTGKRQKYAIHFGSGNIQILPSNRYLCIVPDRGPAETEGVKLPFTGDGMFSTILAKAFLLVDESKITDKTILSQL